MFAWALLIVAAFVGTLMVGVGMIEELPPIISDTWSRMFTRVRS
jgi:hypothetical protein